MNRLSKFLEEVRVMKAVGAKQEFLREASTIQVEAQTERSIPYTTDNGEQWTLKFILDEEGMPNVVEILDRAGNDISDRLQEQDEFIFGELEGYIKDTIEEEGPLW